MLPQRSTSANISEADGYGLSIWLDSKSIKDLLRAALPPQLPTACIVAVGDRCQALPPKTYLRLASALRGRVRPPRCCLPRASAPVQRIVDVHSTGSPRNTSPHDCDRGQASSSAWCLRPGRTRNTDNLISRVYRAQPQVGCGPSLYRSPSY
jgi:hypothetical protein